MTVAERARNSVGNHSRTSLCSDIEHAGSCWNTGYYRGHVQLCSFQGLPFVVQRRSPGVLVVLRLVRKYCEGITGNRLEGT